MLASFCLVSVLRHSVSLLEFADNKYVMFSTVCTTHSLCHPDILFVLPSHYDIVNEVPVFGAGCIHDVLLRVGRRKSVLVIRSSCSAHFLKKRRPLLLHFPTPSVSVTSSQVWWSVPTLQLQLPVFSHLLLRRSPITTGLS